MCENEDCAIHFRNDIADNHEVDPLFVTYLNQWVVYTTLEFSMPADPDLLAEGEAIGLGDMLGLDVAERAIAYLKKVPATAISRVFDVGHGSISDIMIHGIISHALIEHEDTADREDVESLHEEVVEMFRNRK